MHQVFGCLCRIRPQDVTNNSPAVEYNVLDDTALELLNRWSFSIPGLDSHDDQGYPCPVRSIRVCPWDDVCGDFYNVHSGCQTLLLVLDIFGVKTAAFLWKRTMSFVSASTSAHFYLRGQVTRHRAVSPSSSPSFTKSRLDWICATNRSSCGALYDKDAC
jgi:hypothetical protein